MRMYHYQLLAAGLVAPLLHASACLGVFGYPELHLKVSLVAAISAVAAHSLFILFMIVTGRILREAIKSRDLDRTFLDELNAFFAQKAAYPAGILAAFSIVAAGVLGYGAPSLGLPPWIHWIAGLAALTHNLWAFPVELSTLRGNQRLVDRAAAELDRLDAETAARGEPLPEEEEVTPERVAQGAALVAVSAWLPYLYWALVVWRGDFTKASLHPWVEVSAIAGLVWLIARREAARGADSARES